MTNRGIKVLREEKLEPIKDNPVASIDKKLDELWEKKYQYEDYNRRPKEILRQFANDLANAVETNKVQPKELSKEFEGLELAFSFAIAQCLDEESNEHEEKFGRELNFWKYGKYNEDKTVKHPFQWWARPEDIKELNDLLG